MRGKNQFKTFMDNLHTDESYFYKPFKKRNTDFFKCGRKTGSKSETKLLKVDCQLFKRLFISCQTRGCGLREFFSHENHSYPPSLTKKGELRACTNADQGDVLQAKVELTSPKHESGVLTVDGTSLMNAISPKIPKTFKEYAEKDILHFVK